MTVRAAFRRSEDAARAFLWMLPPALVGLAAGWL